jgi:predicted SnoaL-like aldol condensation-catalyzing enzyme
VDRLRVITNSSGKRKEENVFETVTDATNNHLLVTRREKDGTTVVNHQNFDGLVVHSFATSPDGSFVKNVGKMRLLENAAVISNDSPERNKALAIEAMKGVFRRHDTGVLERLFAKNYQEHSSGRSHWGKDLLAEAADVGSAIRYEPNIVVAEGNMVALHGRLCGSTLRSEAVFDFFRFENGKLAEHWGILQIADSGSL